MEERNPSVYLVFDLGNILVQLNPLSGLWGERINPDQIDQLNQQWSASQAVKAYETGQILSLPDFYALAIEEMPISVDFQSFCRIHRQAIGPVFTGTLPMLDKLRQRYRIALLSNTNPDHWSVCRDEQGLADFFDKIYLSYEIGTMKPDRAIFRYVLDDLAIDPQNIWYYDDREDNIIEANLMGFNGHISFGGFPLINDLKKHGFI